MPVLTQPRLFESSVRIPEGKRNEIIELLNARLADAFDLKSQIKFAHWNVKGPNFIQYHELFDQVAAHVEADVDLIAERATALGGVAFGTARLAAASSTLHEYPLNITSGEEHVRAVAERVAAFANATREAIDRSSELGDEATADLFTQVTRELDKDLWFLEAHLQR